MNFPKWTIAISFLATSLCTLAQETKISGLDVDPAVWDTLYQIGSAAGEPRLVIKAKERTPVDEARIMFNALTAYEKDGKDGTAILLNQLGESAKPALDAYRQYIPQGKDLAIEFMAYQIEETVKVLRQLPENDPKSRDFRYVLPLPYHLVEIDAGNLKDTAKFEEALAGSESVLNQYTLKPDQGKARACDNCYLIAIRK